MSTDPDDRRERRLSRDEETIREWAEDHDAVPVRMGSAGGEGRFSLVPEREVSESHEELAWDEFFEQLDEGDHVVVYHGGEAEEPFQVAGQDTVLEGADEDDVERRLMEGETVTSTITETAVVERVVVEEATVESELVDTNLVDERVEDVALLGRTASNCRIVADETADDREWFDVDRYLDGMAGERGVGEPTTMGRTRSDPGTPDDDRMGTGADDMDHDRMGTGDVDDDRMGTDDTDHDRMGTETGTTDDSPTRTGRARDVETEAGIGTAAGTGTMESFPYHVELDVEERWSVTRSFTEEFVVESRVTDTEVTEADTLEEYDVDVEGLHRSIVESGIIEEDIDVEEAMSHYDVESELAEQDRITSRFTRELTVEDQVLDRRRVTADVTSADSEGIEFQHSERVERASAIERDRDETMTTGDRDETMATGDRDVTAGERVTLTEEEEGKPVIDPDGDAIGMVSEVDEDDNTLFVDVDPGLTARIRAALGWGDADAEDYRLGPDEISRVTDDAVELRDPDRIDDEPGR